PDAAKDTDEVPVPAARSSTRSPGPTPRMRCTLLRHNRTCPIDSTSFIRSYRPARASNIAATSAGFLSRSARVMGTQYFFRGDDPPETPQLMGESLPRPPWPAEAGNGRLRRRNGVTVKESGWPSEQVRAL